ncbi:MAG: translation elongation factor Ts, partial [Thermomicrobiaceae bacterium]
MQISASMVKELREKTGAGIMDAKRALEEVEGNMEKAAQVIQQQGLARADKKSDRLATEGLVEPYIHGGGRIGAMVEINCETDFVARTPDFQNLAHDIAMQIAALNPQYVSAADIPSDVLDARADDIGNREEATRQL